MPFFQDPPRHVDLYQADRALQTELNRRLPAEMRDAITPALEELGRATATTLPALAEEAEGNPPVHVPFGPFGQRVDEILLPPAWDGLKRFSAEHGIVATGYDESLGEHRRTVQCALIHLFSSSSATFSCPLAMTDAAARVLLDVAPAATRDRLFSRLTSREFETFITSGQWMTERPGGSDVGGTETVARRLGEDGGEERFSLHGAKWFTSATTSEMALTLARIEDDEGRTPPGSRGLSLFAVEVERLESGGLDGIRVERLKDKLGTRALPTAELTLDGLRATLLGERGRGVPNIATMLNITRWYNALSSASGMARATFLARDYANRREAFGRPIAEQPLHKRTLDDMEAETAAALALCFEFSALLGKLDEGTIADDERRRLRGLIPIAKLTLGKQAVVVASEGLEAFGGAGYVEDTGLPRLLRDAQVLPIWEGTTNVLSLDVLRAEAKDGAFTALLTDLAARAEQLPDNLDTDAVMAVSKTLERVAKRAEVLAKGGDQAALEADARRMAMTTGWVAEAVYMAESVPFAVDGDDEAAARFERFAKLRLMPPMA